MCNQKISKINKIKIKKQNKTRNDAAITNIEYL